MPFSGGSGSLAPIANNEIVGNISGSSAAPVGLTAAQFTALLNAFTSSLAGAVPASGGGTTNYLRADGTWVAPAGSGSVVSVGSGSGLTGGPITTSGSLSLAPIANNEIVGNISGSSAAPIGLTVAQVTALLNVFTSSLAGVVPASGGGTTNYLRADGAWDTPAGGSGSVTSVATGTGLTGGPITSSGTVSLASIAAHSVLGNSNTSAGVPFALTQTQLTAQVNVMGASGITNAPGLVPLPPGTAGSDKMCREDATWHTPYNSITGDSSRLAGNYVSTTTASFTFDELILKSSLGPQDTFCLWSGSVTLNLGSIGVNGLDVSSTLTNATLYIYAIFNEANSGTVKLLATTAGTGQTIYPGSNMPAGYTCSALISAIVLNSSGQFYPFFQIGRDIYFRTTTQMTFTGLTATSFTSLSLATAVPPCATHIHGTVLVASTANPTTGLMEINVCCDASYTKRLMCGFSISGLVTPQTFWNFDAFPFETPQTVWYYCDSSGTTSGTIYLTGFRISV